MLFLRVIAWYGAEKFSLKKVVSIFTSGGDMSLVGPRPERPELQKEIEKEVPEFGLRLQARIFESISRIRRKIFCICM